MVDNSEMIFGVRAVIEAIQAGKEIDKILVKKDIQSDLSKELFAVLKGTLIPDNETETNSHIRRLTDDERVEEIAHMLSGAKLTEAALNNARALLEVSNSK